jgi:L-lactate dehydrogenase complex protein LldG
VWLAKSTILDKLCIEGELNLQDILQWSAPRDVAFTADVSITGVDHLIAETGSVVSRSASQEPRSLSLLPPVHIAVAEERQILPDLFDLFETCSVPPSCLTLITGPSKTGDIELKLVTGVHGPAELHVVLITEGLI